MKTVDHSTRNVAGGPGASPETIAVSGVVTAEDIRLAVAGHRSASRKVLAIALVAALVLMYGAVDAASWAEPSEGLAIAMRDAIIAVAVLVTAFAIPRTWRPLEIPGWKIDRTIGEDGISIAEGGERLFYRWERIARARVFDGVAIVYASKPRSAYIFPRRIFRDKPQWQRFCEIVQANTL